MATTNLGGGSAPGKRPESKRTGIIAVSAIFLAAAVAVAATHAGNKTVASDDARNTGVVDVPRVAPAAQAATGQPANGQVAGELQPNHPPRRLEAVNRQELETTLPKGAPVEITAAEGDAEAFRLAQEIRAFLHAKKYPVADVTRRPPDPSAKGVGLEPLPDGKWRVIVGAAD